MVLGLAVSGQQPIMSKIKNFRVPGYYRTTTGASQTTKLEWLLSGREAQPLASGQVQIQDLRLEYYSAEGATNYLITATDGLFDRATQTATSSGALKVQINGGQLELEGTGFSWEHTNSILVISNNIKTLIRDRYNIQISADRFEYAPAASNAVYRGRVVAQDTNMSFRCESLSVLVPQSGGQVSRIVAETNVVVENRQDQSRATAQRALYVRTEVAEAIELTGNPAWQRGPREGRADVLRYDRLSKTILASGNAYMKLPKADFSQTNSLFAALTPGSATNVLSALMPSVEAYAAEIETLTNGAAFRGHVRINDPTPGVAGQLACDLLRLTTTTNNQLISVLMDGNVSISQGSRVRVAAQRALFTQATETVEFTGSPVWTMEGREGSADRLQFDLKNRVLLADGQAKLTLPLDDTSQPLWAFASPDQPRISAPTNIFVKAEARQYQIGAGLVRFDQNVNAQEWRDGRINSTLKCGMLDVMFKGSNQVENVRAETNVLFEKTDLPKASRPALTQWLKCDRVQLAFRDGKPDNLTAEGGVEFHQADRRVSGSKLAYNPKTQELVWSGSPVRVESPEGSLASDYIVFDQAGQRRIARGHIQIEVNVEKVQAEDQNRWLRP